MRRWLLAALLAIACAGAPAPPAPGTSAAWGRLRLVPREGVTPGGHGAASYGDRRLRDVTFVDYTRPGFAVIYAEEASPPGGRLELAIESSRLGDRLTPVHGAVGSAGRIAVHNESPNEHVLSYPAAGIVRRLAPGEQLEVPIPRTGEQGLFLLDVPASAATVFAAPGPFSVVSQTGRFALTNLAPGPRKLRAWHPRFPPATRSVDLAPDTSVRVDFEIGVGRGDESPEAPHAHR